MTNNIPEVMTYIFLRKKNTLSNTKHRDKNTGETIAVLLTPISGNSIVEVPTAPKNEPIVE